MKTGSSLTSSLLSNYKVKLSCLLIALILWLIVVLGNSYPQLKIIPFRIINLPPGLVLSEPLPDGAEVALRATGKDLIKFSSGEKYIELDMEYTKRVRSFNISRNMIVGMPRNGRVNIEQILWPDTVIVKLEPFIRKRVPVSSTFLQLEPMEGYIAVGSIDLVPDSIYISGPSSSIKGIDSVVTKPYKFSHLIKDFSGKIDLVPPDWDAVSFSHLNARFAVDIQRIHERVLYGIPVQVINVPAGIKAVIADPSQLTLTIHGGVDVVSRLTAEDITAIIDFRKERNRRQSARAAIKIPEDVISWSSKPGHFKLRVER